MPSEWLLDTQNLQENNSTFFEVDQTWYRPSRGFESLE